MAIGSVTVERFDGGAVVVAAGEHDLSTVEEFERGLAEAGERGCSVIADLAEATFIDSTIAGSLLRCARDQALAVVVAPPGGEPRRVLDLLGFGAVAPVTDTRDDALRGLRESA
ncbi:MAG TPA: STAS domain-containing protein [Gaiellales bacterium]|jgi:anti-anti-sigma regulatory factor|nr:STAS domain-containing protein [Gaiellales bacterium]